MKKIIFTLITLFSSEVHADILASMIVNAPEHIQLDSKFYNISLSFDEDKNDLKLKVKTLYQGGIEETQSKVSGFQITPEGKPLFEMVNKKIKLGMMPMIVCQISVPTYFIDDVDVILSLIHI